ncbi:hypothetical protein EAH89_14960 [Roseomonas nepalensis]|uniref:Uncharacterized protein n=1 Tax=Muricoccus nepalensis TaxID=1854500 RepID=A0A502FW40_9PROT|nr:hypothetical protein EAH89_14960 [Roseomonas nepalensis]
MNHTVRLPRARRPASYSAQLVTLWRCLGMRCRRSALALKGMTGVSNGPRDRPCVSLRKGAQSGDLCDKMPTNQLTAAAVSRPALKARPA